MKLLLLNQLKLCKTTREMNPITVRPLFSEKKKTLLSFKICGAMIICLRPRACILFHQKKKIKLSFVAGHKICCYLQDMVVIALLC